MATVMDGRAVPPAQVGERLRNVVGEDHVSAQEDAWIVAPGTEGEVAAIVRLAHQFRLPIRPEGQRQARRRAETQRAEVPGGSAYVILSMTRLCHVTRIDEASLVVHVQAGMVARDLEAALRRRQLTLGDYPPTFFGSSIGGIVAVRTPGKVSPRHGPIEDAIVGLSAVLPSGQLLHTRLAPRKAAGPDVARALAGAEGALGIVTSVALRVHRYHEAHLISAYVLPSLDAAVRAAFLALREEARPAGLRIYDHAAAVRQFPTVTLAADAVLMVMATGGSSDLAACDRDLMESSVVAEGGRVEDPALAETWWRQLSIEQTASPVTMQILSRPSQIASVVAACRAAAAANGAVWRCHLARFDYDGAVAYATLSQDGRDLARMDDGRAATAVRLAAEASGGFVMGTRLVGLDESFLRLRAALDPDGLMGAGAVTEAM